MSLLNINIVIAYSLGIVNYLDREKYSNPKEQFQNQIDSVKIVE